jgi:fimbrial chaperone protein
MKRFVQAALCLSFLLTGVAGNHAVADLLISPTRVAMTEDNRSAEVILRNTSNGARTYRLRWVEQRMKESGAYDRIEVEDNPMSASSMIRFSPRQITVGPGENQTVRLSFRPPAGLGKGEYRSHLLFEILPDVSEPTSTMSIETGMDGIEAELNMMMSFSIPVTIRKQVEPPEVTISNVEVLPAEADSPMRLAVTLNRTGEGSSFGSVLVEYQIDAASEVQLLGRRQNVAIFPELERRRLVIPLRENGIPSGAWVRVAYEGRSEFEGRVWAEKVFQSR